MNQSFDIVTFLRVHILWRENFIFQMESNHTQFKIHRELNSPVYFIGTRSLFIKFHYQNYQNPPSAPE